MTIGTKALLAGLVMAATATAMPVAAQQSWDVKIAYATINDVQDEWGKRFRDRLESRSNGRFKPRVYPSSQLGVTPRQVEGLQLGTIEFMVSPPQYLVGVDPRFQVIAGPGLYQSLEHARRVASDPRIREAVLKIGEAKGLIGVSLFVYGPGGFEMREPLPNPQALKGKKIRVLGSEIETEPVKAFGGTGVPMPLGEVTAAVQQGVIDGAAASVTVAAAFKMQSIAKYHIESNWQIHMDTAFVSKVWFDKLPADLQKLILEEGKAVEPELFGWMVEHQNRAKADWIAGGGVFTEWKAQDHPGMMETVQAATDRILMRDPGNRQLYDLVKQVVKETAPGS